MTAFTEHDVRYEPVLETASWDIDGTVRLLYLAAPVLLFLAFFVRPLLACAVMALVLMALIMTLRRPVMASGSWWVAGGGAVAVALLLRFPTGPFPSDWFKHWALLNTLANTSWPTRIEIGGAPMYLRFYLAAYLVPVSVNKLIPGLPIWGTVSVWFTLGFALVFRSATTLVRRPSHACLALLLLIVLGGADYYAGIVCRLLLQLPQHFEMDWHPGMWATAYFHIPLEYSTPLTLLAWVPHQSIATFLVTGMLMRAGDRDSLMRSVFAYGLLSLWAPFGMIGLLPLMVFRAVEQRRFFRDTRVLMVTAAGLVFALCVVSYLSTDLHGSSVCLNCIPSHVTDDWVRIVAFLLFALLPFVLLLGPQLVSDKTCLIAFLTLLAIPFAYGDSPDFVMRGSMGPLFVLALHGVRALLKSEANRGRYLTKVIVLALCIPTAISEAVYVRESGHAHVAIADESDPLYGKPWVRTFTQRTDYSAKAFLDISGWRFLNQYFTPVKPAILRDAR